MRAAALPVEVTPGGELAALAVAGGTALRLGLRGDYDRAHVAVDALYELAVALDLSLADSQPLFHYHADPEEVAEADLTADLYLFLS